MCRSKSGLIDKTAFWKFSLNFGRTNQIRCLGKRLSLEPPWTKLEPPWTKLEPPGRSWSRLDEAGAAWTKLEPLGRSWSRLDDAKRHVGKSPFSHAWTKLESLGRSWSRLDEAIQGQKPQKTKLYGDSCLNKLISSHQSGARLRRRASYGVRKYL